MQSHSRSVLRDLGSLKIRGENRAEEDKRGCGKGEERVDIRLRRKHKVEGTQGRERPPGPEGK